MHYQSKTYKTILYGSKEGKKSAVYYHLNKNTVEVFIQKKKKKNTVELYIFFCSLAEVYMSRGTLT